MVSAGKVVGMKYVVVDSKGEEIDSSGEEIMEFLAGHQNIISGLEEALMGLKVGDKRSVDVPAAKAYGEVDEELRFEVDLKGFGGQNPPVGATVEMRSEEGHRMIATVAAVQGESVLLDGNHPLAGRDLHFEVEIASIREATEEELAHGHAHGPHGHHHH